MQGWTLLVLFAVAASGCAAQRVSLPGGAGPPLPDFAAIHAEVTRACAGTRTFTAELALAGRAGDERLRGRVVAGFERPASMRLEGVAPFGAPAFILAARGDEAVLLLPRDGRVLRGARADEILGAIAGVRLAPADLIAMLTGCVTASPIATAGHLHENGWASLDLDGGARLFLRRQNDAWQIQAAQRDGWQFEYPAWNGRFPERVRLRSNQAGVRVDLTATLSQIEANVDIDPAAFTVNAAPNAAVLTLEELQAAGPLRGR
ncbi:MAG: hypothetical protein EXQ59_02920 [Acidobacteria bacterium]|nr:hypothetical protein [Acidobacteriota bacterium]